MIQAVEKEELKENKKESSIQNFQVSIEFVSEFSAELAQRYNGCFSTDLIPKWQTKAQGMNSEDYFRAHKIKYNFDGSFSNSFTLTFNRRSTNGQVNVFNAIWGRFQMEISVLNVLGHSRIHKSECAAGAYGNVYEANLFNQNFVIKCITFSKQEVRKDAIFMGFKEYFLYRIASALAVGPMITNILGFDVILYDQCIEFPIQNCVSASKSKHIERIIIQQNLYILHQFGIIHFDIKPDNIMFSRYFNKPIFIDYGLSELFDIRIGQKACVYFRGTLQLCSAEMIIAFSSKNKQMIDVFYNDLHCLLKAIDKIEAGMNDQKEKFVPNVREQSQSQQQVEVDLQKQAKVQNQSDLPLFLLKYQLFSEEYELANNSLYFISRSDQKNTLLLEVLNYLQQLKINHNLIDIFRKFIKDKIDTVRSEQIQWIYKKKFLFMKSFQPNDQKIQKYKRFLSDVLQSKAIENFHQPSIQKILQLLVQPEKYNLQADVFYKLYLQIIDCTCRPKHQITLECKYYATMALVEFARQHHSSSSNEIYNQDLSFQLMEDEKKRQTKFYQYKSAILATDRQGTNKLQIDYEAEKRNNVKSFVNEINNRLKQHPRRVIKRQQNHSKNKFEQKYHRSLSLMSKVNKQRQRQQKKQQNIQQKKQQKKKQNIQQKISQKKQQNIQQKKEQNIQQKQKQNIQQKLPEKEQQQNKKSSSLLPTRDSVQNDIEIGILHIFQALLVQNISKETLSIDTKQLLYDTYQHILILNITNDNLRIMNMIDSLFHSNFMKLEDKLELILRVKRYECWIAAQTIRGNANEASSLMHMLSDWAFQKIINLKDNVSKQLQFIVDYLIKTWMHTGYLTTRSAAFIDHSQKIKAKHLSKQLKFQFQYYYHFIQLQRSISHNLFKNYQQIQSLIPKKNISKCFSYHFLYVEKARIIHNDQKTSLNFAEKIHKTVKSPKFVKNSIFAFYIADYNFNTKSDLQTYLLFLDKFIIKMAVNVSVNHLVIVREILLTFDYYGEYFKYSLQRLEKLFHKILTTLSYLIDLLTLRALVTPSRYSGVPSPYHTCFNIQYFNIIFRSKKRIIAYMNLFYSSFSIRVIGLLKNYRRGLPCNKCKTIIQNFLCFKILQQQLIKYLFKPSQQGKIVLNQKKKEIYDTLMTNAKDNEERKSFQLQYLFIIEDVSKKLCEFQKELDGCWNMYNFIKEHNEFEYYVNRIIQNQCQHLMTVCQIILRRKGLSELTYFIASIVTFMSKGHIHYGIRQLFVFFLKVREKFLFKSNDVLNFYYLLEPYQYFKNQTHQKIHNYNISIVYLILMKYLSGNERKFAMKKATECFEEFSSHLSFQFKIFFYQTLLSQNERSLKEGKALNMNIRKYAFLMKTFIKLAVHTTQLQRLSRPKKIKTNIKQQHLDINLRKLDGPIADIDDKNRPNFQVTFKSR